MGVSLGEAWIEPDEFKELRDSTGAFRASSNVVDVGWLAQDRANGHARVQRGIRILEDHLHAASKVVKFTPLSSCKVVSVKVDCACARLYDAGDRACNGALAAARLANKAKDLPLRNLKRDAIHCTHLGNGALAHQPLANRESDREVFDRQQGLAAHRVAPPERGSGRPSATSSGATGLKQAATCVAAGPLVTIGPLPPSIGSRAGVSVAQRSVRQAQRA